jgi:riboflavin kinase/FMN adenylyltransferase
VRPDSAPKLLTDLEQKLELLATTGVDATLVVRFDEDRAHEPAEDFVTEILVDALDSRIVSVGADFHFGHKRRGNVAMLEAMGETSGFDVVPIELVRVAGVDGPVSSTRIRHALRDGDVELAATLLGRPHEVRGSARDGILTVPEDIALPAAGTYTGSYDGHTGEIVVGDTITVADPITDPQCHVCFVAPLAGVRQGDVEGTARRLGS